MIRHPDRMLAPVRRLRTRSTVARLEDRYVQQLRFLTDRLHLKNSAAFTLMIALLLSALTEITEDRR